MTTNMGTLDLFFFVCNTAINTSVALHICNRLKGRLD